MTKYITATIRNIKTQEEIMFVVEDNDVLKQATGLYLKKAPKKSIKAKLLEYVATDTPLTDIQKIHAFGWSAAFQNQSKLFQKNSKIKVGWMFHKNSQDLKNWLDWYTAQHKQAGAEMQISSTNNFN